MTYTIKVQKNPEYAQLDNPDLFVRTFNSREEFQAVGNLCDNKRRIGWLESLMVPVRTDTVSNFCKDFFLPGLFNVALKTNELAARIFLCILTPIYDILTLPIRFITVIPRSIYNLAHPKESHPFYQYLINNGVAAVDLSDGHVYLETECEETTRGDTFNFMQLPRTSSNIRHAFSSRLQIEVV